MLLDSDINFNFKEDGWSVYMNGEKIKHVNSQKIHKKINVFDISLIKTKQKFHNDTLRCVINNKTDTLLDVSFLLDEGFLYSRVDSLYDEILHFIFTGMPLTIRITSSAFEAIYWFIHPSRSVNLRWMALSLTPPQPISFVTKI